MSLKKRYLKSRDACKVTFSLPSDLAGGAGSAHLVGEFNGWNIYETPMKKLKNGAFSVTLELEKGREYQFRYLVDQERWHNDSNADAYAPTEYGEVENSVVRV